MVMIIKKGSAKEEIDRLLEKLNLNEEVGIDAYKYCGILKLLETPDEIQNRLRSEWD